MRSGTDAVLVEVWGFNDHRVYALSSDRNEICYYDGSSWQAMSPNVPPMNDMTSIWGSSPSDLFVVDYRGIVKHFDGQNWTPLPRVLSSGLIAVSGVGGDALVVGYEGVVTYER
jgi:hypothetical protein